MTDADKLEVWTRYQATNAPAEVARDLGFAAGRVRSFISNIKQGRIKAPVAGAPVLVAEMAPQVAPEVDPVAETVQEVASEPADISEPVEEIDTPEPVSDPLPTPGGGWSPAEDLLILRQMGQGKNSWAVSQMLKGRSAASVVNRFRELVPQPGIANQARALKRAQEAVDLARGRIAAE